MFTRHFAHWPPGIPRSIDIPRVSVFANLAASAARHPGKTAISYYGTHLSYGGVLREAEALAGFLQRRCGVRRGDRVLLFCQNSPQFIIGFYAILRADAVVVPVNPMNKTDELRHYVQDAGAAVMLTTQELWPHAEPLAQPGSLEHVVVGAPSDYLRAPTDLPVPDFVRAAGIRVSHPRFIAWQAAIGADEAAAPHTAAPGDLAVMPYTSGTTGHPKGCMHTHFNVQSTASAYVPWRSIVGDAVVLAALPLFHVTGMQGNMNGPIQSGSTIVVMSRWDRDCAAMLIERERVTTWSAITTMVVDFLANPKLDQYDLSSLAVLGGGGAAMPEALAKKLRERLGLEFMEGYGLSETMAPSHINPPHRPKRQCAGIPIFDTDSRVLDPETLRELGPNEVGEIVIHGPQVFQGYWNQPEATAQAFIEHDGKRFFRSGDLGYYDEEGYFFITDRLKRMINASGFKVWPAEVEALLYAHPDIQEACVIGTRDPYRGESVKAFIVPKAAARDRLRPEDIVEWSRAHMAAFKVPRVVEVVDELPKTATGKILWRKLQEEENARAAQRS
jgi:fatty-acyl-CoA synthase